MLIAVLSLGAAILGATTVAGLLTLYQIRATTDTANSAKAVFAADEGADWALFNYYCAGDGRCSAGAGPALPTLTNGATLVVTCYSTSTASVTSDCDSTTTVAAISTGESLNSARSFYLGIQGSTTTYP